MPRRKATRGYGHRVGKREDLGGISFRSSWEANIARWLNHLIECGAEVQSWQYEPQEFRFPVRRGPCAFYKPDFCITRKDGSQYYLEIKAYMDKTSKRKLQRMRLYHPDVEVQIIDKSGYRNIEQDACRIIANWE